MSATDLSGERVMVTQAEKRGRGRPVTSDRDDASVRIDREVKAQAEYVAAKRRIPIAEYLTGLLSPTVARDFRQAQDKQPA